MRLSIVTATHKRPVKLRDRCLPSVLSQTCRDFEWVVVNDGADEATKDLVEAVSGEIDVTYLSTPHQGLIASRNLGLDKATGDLIAFLDDDNVLAPTFVERMLSHFDEHPDISMSVPIRRQRRDVYRDGVRIRAGKQMRRPLPEATNVDFVKGNPPAWFDSNGFVHKRDDTIRFNPETLIMSDYEYLLQCFGAWGLDSLLVCEEELVDYIQTNEGIIGSSSWEDWLRDLEYLWNHRSGYKIFETVSPEPWLREQMEDARARALAGEDLPGFPRNLTEGG